MERGTEARRLEKDRQEATAALRPTDRRGTPLNGVVMTLRYNKDQVVVQHVHKEGETAQQFQQGFQQKVEESWRTIKPIFLLTPAAPPYMQLEYVSKGELKQFRTEAATSYPAQSGGSVPGNVDTWMRATVKMFEASWASNPPDIS